ncbi:unnamed protein product [Periconia digitata]|uniref:Uncharacterized protein n=1 Tax=Periconia digitata TaxID=1303443 RepID=A0A9W4UVJ9_9PLEO|nr:unnamed protein product [Periconia digitata]
MLPIHIQWTSESLEATPILSLEFQVFMLDLFDDHISHLLASRIDSYTDVVETL